MDSFNEEELKWLKLAIEDNLRYSIYVDNDDVFVIDNTKIVFQFNNYGYEFAIQLLEYLGCNVHDV